MDAAHVSHSWEFRILYATKLTLIANYHNHRDMRYADDDDERPNHSVSICSSIGALGNNP